MYVAVTLESIRTQSRFTLVERESRYSAAAKDGILVSNKKY